MPNFRRGIDATREATARRGNAAFANYIYWGNKSKEDRTKLVQFLTPLDEMLVVLWHEYIITGYRDNGKPIFSNFVSQRDRTVAGLDGEDPVHDIWGLKPKEKNILVAVELEPLREDSANKKKITGVRPVVARTYMNKDGDEVEVPAIGFVIQSPFNFTNSLISWQETQFETSDDPPKITDKVFRIVRGTEKPIQYDATALDGVPTYDVANLQTDFPGFRLPDVDAFLEEMADLTRQKQLLDPAVSKVQGVEDPWSVWPISNFKPDEWDKNRKKSLVDAPAEAVEEAPVEEDRPKGKTSRFARLKAEAEAGHLSGQL
jgi:hypothetical protein